MNFHRIALCIAAIFFFIPFFWLKPGYVDLGGDAGRLYFFEPFSIARNLYQQQLSAGFGSNIYAMLPYILVLSVLKQIISSPTYLISLEHGVQLSFSFFFVYLLVRQFVSVLEKEKNILADWVGIVSGIVYVGFITKTGWVTSLEIHNQVFLNPLMFYLFLKFSLTSRFRYAFFILLTTIAQSQNFGFSSSPQLFSFYPFALMFLYIYLRFFAKKSIQWRNIAGLAVLFLMIHAFHLLPIVAAIFDNGGELNAYIFSETVRDQAGLRYFDHNRQAMGKLSWELFQPARWNTGSMLILLIPFVSFLGFLKARSMLLSLIGFFFAVTFFLVSANITLIGVKLYRKLFSIPGFMMFRSFDEKWYYVFIFFYTLLFATSLYFLLKTKKLSFSLIVGCILIVSILYRIFPFIRGDFYETWHPSSKVPVVFDLDPNLSDALNAIKLLPEKGDVLTFPLTLPYFQVIHGKTTGAYVGLSMIQHIAGKQDYPGFWSFGQHQHSVLNALKEENIHHLLQLLSLRNIGYIFRNSDIRSMEEFPTTPYYKHDITVDIPIIDNQNSYDRLLSMLPVTKQYERGVFQIYEFSDEFMRPRVYIPDIIYASESEALENQSFRSAYVDKETCERYQICQRIHPDIHELSFRRFSPTTYVFSIDIKQTTRPFILILLENYHKTWNVKVKDKILQPILVNGYANGWIIDPDAMNLDGAITGTIELGFQRYFFWGRIVSLTGGIVLLLATVYFLLKQNV